jgi:hypothetical protein
LSPWYVYTLGDPLPERGGNRMEHEPEARAREQIQELTGRPASSPPLPKSVAVRTREPYEWLSAVIALYVLIAVAAVIGGFAEAGNHSHRVVHAGEFGIGRSVSIDRDYNYAYVGIAAGVFWTSLAILMALVRSIARDTRRSADAAVGPSAATGNAPASSPQ